MESPCDKTDLQFSYCCTKFYRKILLRGIALRSSCMAPEGRLAITFDVFK